MHPSAQGPSSHVPLRLDFVSPLPPVRSGIADYSVDLLPHLAALCDVRIIPPAGLPVRQEILARWPSSPPETVGEDGRLPLYQMGNNRYHEGVYELAMRQPGVLTLHDLVLHHFLLDRTLLRGDFSGYRRRLAEDHGWIGDAIGAVARWGVLNNATQFSLPARRALLRRQRGVLVHSAWAAREIRDEDPAIRVRAVPMGVPLPPPVDPQAGRAFRRRCGIPADSPLLGSLGFQTPIKRTSSVIAALASPELGEVHLLVAGEVAPILDLEREALDAGVADRVHVAGFLDFADYQAAIAACDLCVNLRYPTAGETSAALLRVLAAGRAALVSEYGQFAELPDAVAVKIPVGEGEVEALRARVRVLVEAPDRLRAMGQAARDYVACHHDPAGAARAVIEACAAWREAEPPGEAPAAAPAPTTAVWGALPGSLVVEGADPPWAVGELRRLRIRIANRGFARWLSAERGAGGVVVRVEFRGPGDDTLPGGAWVALLPDLGAGGVEEAEVEVRRPPGAAHILVEPHILGRAGFNAFGGPAWQRAV